MGSELGLPPSGLSQQDGEELYREMIEEKKLPPKTIPRAAVLSINVVNFTHLSSDATPEELTSILNKLFETIEHRLENYDNLFTVKVDKIKII